MATTRTTAAAVGGLILTATATYLIGDQLVASAMSATNSLANLNSDQIRTGVLFQLVNCAAVVGIGALLFPILRRHREGMALGYTATRIIESVMLLVSALSPLLLLALSQAGATQLETLGTLATEWYDMAFQFSMTTLGIGSLLLCYILYAGRLVPRILPVLGFVGYIALAANGLLEIFGYSMGTTLFIPGAIFEAAFPIWLIVKGFAEPAATPVTAATG